MTGRIDRCPKLVPGLAWRCTASWARSARTDVLARDTLLCTGPVAPHNRDPSTRLSFSPLEGIHGERLERDAVMSNERGQRGARVGRNHDARRALEREEKRRGGDGQRPDPQEDATSPSDSRAPVCPMASFAISNPRLHETRLWPSIDSACDRDELVTSGRCRARGGSRVRTRVTAGLGQSPCPA